MKRLTGLIAATFTPMHADGSVNLAPVPAMVDGLLRNGITALYVCGSTGEGPSLTTEERERAAEAFVDAAAGRLHTVDGMAEPDVVTAQLVALLDPLQR